MTELRSRRNQLILIVVALLAVLLLLGFWLQNSFSARISDLEKSQNAQQQEFSTELGDVKNKINSVTVDDREVGGDIAMVGGGDTTTNQNRTNTTQNDSTNVSSDVGSSQMVLAEKMVRMVPVGQTEATGQLDRRGHKVRAELQRVQMEIVSACRGSSQGLKSQVVLMLATVNLVEQFRLVAFLAMAQTLQTSMLRH